MGALVERACVPCRGGGPPLTSEQIEPLALEVADWQVVDNHHLKRTYEFADFRTALDFAVQAGELAEEQRHHPDLHLSWGRVMVEIWTHKINGLTESDFILAAKIDRLFENR